MLLPRRPSGSEVPGRGNSTTFGFRRRRKEVRAKREERGQQAPCDRQAPDNQKAPREATGPGFGPRRAPREDAGETNSRGTPEARRASGARGVWTAPDDTRGKTPPKSRDRPDHGDHGARHHHPAPATPRGRRGRSAAPVGVKRDWGKKSSARKRGVRRTLSRVQSHQHSTAKTNLPGPYNHSP